jgi:putative endonuclease
MLMSDEHFSGGDNHRQRLGSWGEAIAAQYLESKGYRILARNWRNRFGEIDLIVADGEGIAFVEVKTRHGRRFGSPEEAITVKKGQRLLQLGQAYISEHEMHDQSWRIDLVAIEVDDTGHLLRCEHIPHVVLGW